MTGTRARAFTGFALAISSAASFALSGIFASALLSAGWSAGAAATARIVCSAIVLLPATIVLMRGRWHLVRSAWLALLMFGVLAVAGCQLAYFLAVQFIPPSLALLIEFTGPVFLMVWFWLRTRHAPSALTLLGAGIALLGLVAISGVATGTVLHPLGIAFALAAAIGNAAYYATGAMSDHGIPTLPFVGLGLLIAALVLVVASFTGYSEPLFGIVWTIALLAIMPSGLQWVGACGIIAGVSVVKLGELVQARRNAPTVPPEVVSGTR